MCCSNLRFTTPLWGQNVGGLPTPRVGQITFSFLFSSFINLSGTHQREGSARWSQWRKQSGWLLSLISTSRARSCPFLDIVQNIYHTKMHNLPATSSVAVAFWKGFQLLNHWVQDRSPLGGVHGQGTKYMWIFCVSCHCTYVLADKLGIGSFVFRGKTLRIQSHRLALVSIFL